MWKGCKRHMGNQTGFPDVENARTECSELLLWELSAELLSEHTVIQCPNVLPDSQL